MYKSLSHWVAGAILAIATVSTASAAVLSWTGTVSDIPAPTGVVVGDTITGAIGFSEFNGLISSADFSVNGSLPNIFDTPVGTLDITAAPPGNLDTLSASFVANNGSMFLSVSTLTDIFATNNLAQEISEGFSLSAADLGGLSFASIDFFDANGVFLFTADLTSVTAVPEPSVLALLGLGILGMVYGRRKITV